MERKRIAQLLPEIYQRSLAAQPNVLNAFLGVMETHHAPTEVTLENLDAYIDVHRTSDAWLPFLAAWVDFDRFLNPDGKYPAGFSRLRSLLLFAVKLAPERGTIVGLKNFLEIATGLTGFQIEEDLSRPYHIHVTSPQVNDKLPLGELMTPNDYEAWVKSLIRAEKPAYVTFEFKMQQEN